VPPTCLSVLVPCLLMSTLLRVGVKRLHNTTHHTITVTLQKQDLLSLLWGSSLAHEWKAIGAPAAVLNIYLSQAWLSETNSAYFAYFLVLAPMCR